MLIPGEKMENSTLGEGGGRCEGGNLLSVLSN